SRSSSENPGHEKPSTLMRSRPGSAMSLAPGAIAQLGGPLIAPSGRNNSLTTSSSSTKTWATAPLTLRSVTRPASRAATWNTGGWDMLALRMSPQKGSVPADGGDQYGRSGQVENRKRTKQRRITNGARKLANQQRKQKSAEPAGLADKAIGGAHFLGREHIS